MNDFLANRIYISQPNNIQSRIVYFYAIAAPYCSVFYNTRFGHYLQSKKTTLLLVFLSA